MQNKGLVYANLGSRAPSFGGKSHFLLKIYYTLPFGKINFGELVQQEERWKN